MRTYGLHESDWTGRPLDGTYLRGHPIPIHWGVLDLDGRRFLVNETFTEAVPAGERGPGQYVWQMYRRGYARVAPPNPRDRAKQLAKVLKARLRALDKAAR